MKIIGFSKGYTKFSDETQQYHIILEHKGISGAACNRNRLVSGTLEKVLDPNANVCRRCQKIIPEFRLVIENKLFIKHIYSGLMHIINEDDFIVTDDDGNRVYPNQARYFKYLAQQINDDAKTTLKKYFPTLINEEPRTLKDIPPGNAFEFEVMDQKQIFVRLNVNSDKNNVINTASWIVGSIDLNEEVKDLGQLKL